MKPRSLALRDAQKIDDAISQLGMEGRLDKYLAGPRAKIKAWRTKAYEKNPVKTSI